jgi:hypothetical protein
LCLHGKPETSKSYGLKAIASLAKPKPCFARNESLCCGRFSGKGYGVNPEPFMDRSASMAHIGDKAWVFWCCRCDMPAS